MKYNFSERVKTDKALRNKILFHTFVTAPIVFLLVVGVSLLVGAKFENDQSEQWFFSGLGLLGILSGVLLGISLWATLITRPFSSFSFRVSLVLGISGKEYLVTMSDENFNKFTEWHDSDSTEVFIIKSKSTVLRVDKKTLVSYRHEGLSTIRQVYEPFLHATRWSVPYGLSPLVLLKLVSLASVGVGAYLFVYKKSLLTFYIEYDKYIGIFQSLIVLLIIFLTIMYFFTALSRLIKSIMTRDECDWTTYELVQVSKFKTLTVNSLMLAITPVCLMAFPTFLSVIFK